MSSKMKIAKSKVKLKDHPSHANERAFTRRLAQNVKVLRKLAAEE